MQAYLLFQIRGMASFGSIVFNIHKFFCRHAYKLLLILAAFHSPSLAF